MAILYLAMYLLDLTRCIYQKWPRATIHLCLSCLKSLFECTMLHVNHHKEIEEMRII